MSNAALMISGYNYAIRVLTLTTSTM